MPNDSSPSIVIPAELNTLQRIRNMLFDRGMTASLPELQYQPRFEKKGHYSRKGYAFGKPLRLKRKK